MQKTNTFSKKLRRAGGFFRRLPLFSRIVFILTAVSMLTHVLFYISAPFADFYNRTVSVFARGTLALLSGLLPFSIAEVFIALLLPLTVFLLIVAYRLEGREAIVRYTSIVLAAMLLLYNTFVISFAAGYRTPPLQEKLAQAGVAEKADVGEEESLAALYKTARFLTAELVALVPEIHYDAYGASISPLSFESAADAIQKSYARLYRDTGIGTPSLGRAKPVALSALMAYTNILGVYTFFTGEANVNVHFTDFNTVYTAAHEMAHQRGFAREDEANFMAFLACYHSGNAYLRYAGCWELLRYVLSDLSRASSVHYEDICDRIPDEVWGDQARYNALFAPYRETAISKVSHAVNDTYLKVQGTGGAVSYGGVVKLAVSYVEKMLATGEKTLSAD